MTLDAIDINGCRIAYRLDGPRDAPVVMLSNSLSSNLSMWNGRIAALAAGCRATTSADTAEATRPRAIHDRIAGSELVILDDAAHLSNIEQKDAFNAALLEFLG